ncbi:MAG: hypothetical protein CFE28_16220 [Alphaproteobacteria bacterium PA2]|nr:MAG: hypothetical protein CFE28_16220 [Alphaproteobacteria bacterium PA2]
MTDLKVRLDQIRGRITSDDFLTGKGLGNEVPFYAFDYAPGDEPQVDAYVSWLAEDLDRKTSLKVTNVNLFALVVEVLRSRRLYEKAIALETAKGAPALLSALKGPLEAGKLAHTLMERVQAEKPDTILLTGVGAAYPFVRTHSLLNNLQPLIGTTPVVLFFPGRFNGQTLQLFGELQETPYYRAFRLVD